MAQEFYVLWNLSRSLLQVQIMENEFECLVVRWGDDGHFAEKFVKKYCSYPKLSRLPRRNSAVVTRQRLRDFVEEFILKCSGGLLHGNQGAEFGYQNFSALWLP